MLAIIVAWSSIVDNSAVCNDDDGPIGSGPCSTDGAPASAPCISCPCRLPLTAASPMRDLDPLRDGHEEVAVWQEHHFHAIASSASHSSSAGLVRRRGEVTIPRS